MAWVAVYSLVVMTAYWHIMFLSVNCILNDWSTADTQCWYSRIDLFLSISRTFSSFPCTVNQWVCLWCTHSQSCTTSTFVQEETGLTWLEAGWLQVCDHAVWCGSVSLYQFELMGGKSNSSGTVNLRVLLWLCRLDWLNTAGSGLDKVDRDKR